ncbi:MAG: hypothetical protein AAF585_16165 [Verrucomicrobiota bacterium]
MSAKSPAALLEGYMRERFGKPSKFDSSLGRNLEWNYPVGAKNFDFTLTITWIYGRKKWALTVKDWKRPNRLEVFNDENEAIAWVRTLS